jgi:hypothetical protein
VQQFAARSAVAAQRTSHLKGLSHELDVRMICTSCLGQYFLYVCCWLSDFFVFPVDDYFILFYFSCSLILITNSENP